MKGEKKGTVKSKRSRIIKYSAFTVLLTCVIVTGYYLVSNGIIFGKYVSKSPYIEQKYIDNPNLVLTESEASPDLTVTAKNSFSSYKTLSPVMTENAGPELPEFLAFQEKEGDTTGATHFSGKRTIYFNVGSRFKTGDLYTSVSIASANADAKLTLFSVDFVKSREDDTGSRTVSIYAVNETSATSDKDSCRTDVSWNPDGSVSYVTKKGGMQFYIDGLNRNGIDLKDYGYLKVVVESDSETVVRGYKTLPSVPETDGTIQKGTKGNPLVILEIVPELAQQSLSLLVSSQEEGLLLDPIEFGREVTKKKNVNFITQHHTDNISNNVRGYRDVWAGEGTSAVTDTGLDNELKGWFNNNNGGTLYEIYNPDGTVPGASKQTNGEKDRATAPFVYLTAHYTVQIKCDLQFGAEFSNGSSKKSISEIQSAYPDLFVDKNGEQIDERALTDDKNWAWNYKKDESENKEYRVKVPSSESFEIDVQKYKNNEITFTELANAHKALFKTTTDGSEVLDTEIERAGSWKIEKEEAEKQGYMVYVGLGGDFALDVNNIWQEKNATKNTWMYVGSKADLPADYTEIWPEGKQAWEVSNAINNNTVKNAGFPVSRMQVDGLRDSNWNLIKKFPTQTTYTFKYKYDGYIFEFRYIGIRFNEILKRQLFYYYDDKDSDGNVIKTADQKYDETYIKIITLTPSMINQMDDGDSASTLDYIERADMFYISNFDTGTDGINNLMALYTNFVDPARDKNTFHAYDGELASFHENDLEWVDVMKIIKRLSGDSSLPMLFSSQVGTLLDEGVTRDGALSQHMYIDDKVTCGKKPGSLNNISKLYLICTQFDLSADKDKPNNKIQYTSTFMDDIYDNIKQVPLTSDDARDPNTAKYTGYYQRPMLCGCSSDKVSDKEKQEVYYLWNILTFLPIVPTEPAEDSLYNSDHTDIQSKNFLKYGFLESSLTGSGNYRHSYLPGRGTEMGRVPGTTDPEADFQNVVVIHRQGQVDNGNFSIFEGGIFNAIGMITHYILNNGTPLTPTMSFSVLNTKESRKYYQKLSNDSVLIDYSQSAAYKADRTLYLYCNLNNAENEETSIITSVTMINPDTDATITIVPEKLDGTKLTKENIDFSEAQSLFSPIKGYGVSKKDSLNFTVPFSLKKWQQGFTVIRVDWVSRSSKLKGTTFTPYQNPNDPTDSSQVEVSKQYAEVSIGERGLFALQ